jgi:hypothetical protein
MFPLPNPIPFFFFFFSSSKRVIQRGPCNIRESIAIATKEGSLCLTQQVIGSLQDPLQFTLPQGIAIALHLARQICHPDSRMPGPSSPNAPMPKVHPLQWPHPNQSPFRKNSLTLPHIQRSANNTLRPRAEQRQRRPHIQQSANNTLRPRAGQCQRRRWYMRGSWYVDAS